ncbi:MAG: 30S ribosomal protein S12 methylthiotransferase RimO [Coriobacteriia bacterium]|nr:30S ribosomal protein S12 methylthiotransferase RimO [Coriobacteriia bacterium]
MQSNPHIAFVTLGCPKNEVDTDYMRTSARNAGYDILDDPELADVIIVNTCSFIREATEESIETVLAAIEARSDGLQRKVVVAGCMPSRYGSELSASLPEVAAFLPVAEEALLLELLTSLVGPPATSGAKPTSVSTRTVAGPSAYLQVSDGCNRACTYCAIPAIRGPYKSRPLVEIVAEAAELTASGVRELVLIGQDTSSYGMDLYDGNTLADVVRAVAAVDGVRWLRLMYVQPDGVSDGLLSAIAENPNVCRYLDLPLQHASSSVLRRMRRGGDATQFRALLVRIRSALPDCVLRTTVIAGFPGETREDASELKRFLRHSDFDYVGVFPFSPEEGTEAADLPGQVPARTRRARAQSLRDLADEIGIEHVSRRIGSVLEVLVEGIDEDEGVVFGRWRGQAPDIDGVVLLDRGKVGEIVLVRIEDSLGYDLEGEVL